MARAEVVHSEDAVCVLFRGNPRRPEPTTGVIRFPGGHIEVSRCSDGSYWAHIHAYPSPPDEDSHAGVITDTRIDYRPDGPREIPPIPAGEFVQHVAIRVARAALAKDTHA